MLFDMQVLDPTGPLMFGYFSYRRSAYLEALSACDDGHFLGLEAFIMRGVTDVKHQQLEDKINSRSLLALVNDSLPEKRFLDQQCRSDLSDPDYSRAIHDFGDAIDRVLDAVMQSNQPGVEFMDR